MSEASVEDYRWLTSDSAENWLQRLRSESTKSLHQQLRLLRRDLPEVRAHLLMEQHELQQRAAVKFSRPEQMRLTRRSLEQASEEVIGQYKATRYSGDQIVDVCCGIGGDAIGLATGLAVEAIDRDPVVACFAEFNTAGLKHDVRVHCREACPAGLADGQVHLDPDRRAGRSRTIRLIDYEPNRDFVMQTVQQAQGGAVKVAPACEVDEELAAIVEQEWIGTRGECRQQVLWSGSTADVPGEHRATGLVREDGRAQVAYTVHGEPDQRIAPADGPSRFLYEPAPEVLAARLVGELADQLKLQRPFPALPYLTSDDNVEHPALQTFRVIEVAPFDRRRIKRMLRAHNVGRLEVKKRGTHHDPAELQRVLSGKAGQPTTLILAGVARRVTAVLARRE